MKAKPADYGKNLRVNRSAKHGRGVYATAPIPRAAKVIEYVGKLVPVKDSDGIAEKQMTRAGKSGTGHVYLFTLNKRYDIDGNVPWNKARLINHSCDPNCEAQIIQGRIWVTAKRKIAAGEELTYDYGFNMDSWQEHVCRCGTAKCLGYIVSASRRGALARVLKKKQTQDANPVMR
ncbi:MAG: SET domain-containing protein-lysine N-methyltransferase [Spirochaetes bacterium]|nr:SET domain-containing protein-lysine N-methyltransferase [Spirochaetota bacterium]